MERNTRIEFPTLGLTLNDGIEGGTLNLNQVLYTEDLRFGQLCANMFEVSLYGIGDISGQRVVVSQIIDGTEIKKFDGYVDSSTLDEFGYYRKIVAYDKAYTVNQKDVVDWWNRFWSSKGEATLKQLRQSILAEFGLTENVGELFNDDYVVTNNIDLSSAKFVDVFKYITELQAVMPNINADGVVEYVYPVSTNAKTDIKNYYEKGNSTFEEYESGFSGVHVTDSDGNIVYSVGSDNLFYTVSNMFLFDKNAEELKDFADRYLERIKDIKTVPSNIKMIYSNPSINLGDLVESSNGVHIVSSINMSGIMLIEQNLKSEGQPQREVKESSYRFDMQVIKGKTAKLKADIEGLEVEFGEFEKDTNEKYSSLKMDADGLKVEVSSLQKQFDGATEVYYTKDVPTLENYPAWDFTYNIPVYDENVYPLDAVQIYDDTRFEYNDSFYRKSQGSLVYDEENFISYRFVKNPDTGSWHWKSLENTDFGLVLGKVTDLEVSVDGIKTNVSEVEEKLSSQEKKIEENTSSIKQTKDEITTEVSKNYQTISAMGNYSTTTQMNSAIRQSARDISSTVSKTYQTKEDAKSTYENLSSEIYQTAEAVSSKVSKGDIASTINQTAQSVKIDSSKIDLIGFVTVSDLKTGGKTEINGENVTTGKVKAKYLDVTGVFAQDVTATGTITGAKLVGANAEITKGSLKVSGTSDRDAKVSVSYGTHKTGMDSTGVYVSYGTSHTAQFTIADMLLMDTSTNNKQTHIQPVRWLMYDEGYTSPNRHYFNPTYYRTSGTIYTPTGTVSASDKNLKNSIEELDIEKSSAFIYSLKPSRYKYNDGESGRFHHGLIAQEVKESMGDDDWGLYVDTHINGNFSLDEEDFLALRYEELIADLIATVQSQNERIKVLESALKGGK